MSEGERVSPFRARHVARRAMAAELVLTVLRESPGTWYAVSGLHALVRQRARVGGAMVASVLIELERAGRVECQLRHSSLGRVPQRWWRVTPSDGEGDRDVEGDTRW